MSSDDTTAATRAFLTDWFDRLAASGFSGEVFLGALSEDLVWTATGGESPGLRDLPRQAGLRRRHLAQARRPLERWPRASVLRMIVDGGEWATVEFDASTAWGGATASTTRCATAGCCASSVARSSRSSATTTRSRWRPSSPDRCPGAPPIGGGLRCGPSCRPVDRSWAVPDQEIVLACPETPGDTERTEQDNAKDTGHRGGCRGDSGRGRDRDGECRVGGGDGGPERGVVTHATTSYSSPSNQSAPVSSLPKDTALQVQCVVEGQTPAGSSNFYWFRISDPNGSSFVHRDSVTVAPDLRHC